MGVKFNPFTSKLDIVDSPSGEFSDIELALGTQTAPSLSFTGDPNTGIYSPGADQVAISTGGTGRLFVDANGNVTQQSDSPDLIIKDTQSHTTSDGPLVQFQGRGPNGINYNFGFIRGVSSGINNAGILQFGTNNAGSQDERMRITSAGLVGIGTSDPAELLEVRSETTNAARLRVTGSGTTAGNYRGYEFGAGSAFKGGLLQDESTDLISIFTPVGGQSVNITSAGNVGIGTQNPGDRLELQGGDFRISTNSLQYHKIAYASNNFDFIANAGSANQSSSFVFSSSASGGAVTERARIDSSGRLLVGTSSARDNFFNDNYSGLFQVEGANNETGQRASVFVYGASNATGPILALGKHRSNSIGGSTIVASGDEAGVITFQGADNTEFVEAARITAAIDGNPGANDMPGRLVFSTTEAAAASPTERMRIDSSGRFLVNTQTIAFTGTNSWFGVYGDASPSTSFAAQSSAGTVAYINRQTDDGELIAFFQDGTQEGSISVSGTTVLFNGAHLSRWSQLPGGAERIEIMRGSVLSNIDEMCEWGEEDNEQLNRMKVSDVEGDKNVSGVFQSWDNDDDTYTNDFYCAMTGDFVIRIAAGITVERGDLLMSAGDGTAKPQDDDIIRSKTIAKVTSTNVSCTYDDGSYCVPCVLMAC
jgi:hypothetical protein